jgi:ABC-2 type transport system ATP-binding protein
VTSPAIEVRGLGKSFGNRRAVDGLDLEVPEGIIIGFLGANGSGKTTMIRMLCGLLTPDAGSGTCLGFDLLREARAIKREVGYMPQHFGLYEDLTVRENLEFVARLYAVPDRPRRVASALDRLGLADRSDQLAGTLSGGWKQRLALAACMIHDPRLLLLDEPTAGVDPEARRRFWDEIHGLAASGITVLVSTHYMDEAERCHELAYLAEGRLLFRGTPQEIVARSRLVTFSVVNAPGLAERLRAMPGVEMVVASGARLHVSGIDPALIERSLAAEPGLAPTREAQPRLEDVFVRMIREAAR